MFVYFLKLSVFYCRVYSLKDTENAVTCMNERYSARKKKSPGVSGCHSESFAVPTWRNVIVNFFSPLLNFQAPSLPLSPSLLLRRYASGNMLTCTLIKYIRLVLSARL